MTTRKKSPAPPVTDPSVPPEMTVVTLRRIVEIQGHAYKPGVRHTVSAGILAEMGDAVLTRAPAAAPPQG